VELETSVLRGLTLEIERLAFRRAQLNQTYAGLDQLQTQLMTIEQQEAQSYQRRLDQIDAFLANGYITQQKWFELNIQAAFAHETQMTQIRQQGAQHVISAQMAAGQAFSNLLGIMGQKSKAAAIAAIAVNTALQAAQAIQNTAAAQTRALAELGPIAGPPAAAAIGAWGATQVALIIAAGALQGFNQLKGGPAVPGAGGGGGAIPALPQDEDRRAPTLISVEGVDPAAFFSGQVLIDLVGKLNEAVQNGNVLISTRNIAGLSNT
jgi:hypothetical protein